MYSLKSILFLLLLCGVTSGVIGHTPLSDKDNTLQNNIWQDVSLSAGSKTPVSQEGTSCSKDSECQKEVPDSFCNKKGQCDCIYGYYSYNSTVCSQCPGQGEDCSISNCCYSPSMYLTCMSGVCDCVENYNGLICWNTNSSQRYRFQKVAQFILAIGLIFTSIIIVILFWKACSSGVHSTIPHVDSYVSLNSIQRLVLLRLQDRPPTYNQIYQPMKRQAAARRIPPTIPTAPVYEQPPPYSEALASNQAYENRIFYINEQTPSENTDTPTSGALPIVTTTLSVSEEQKPELHI